MSFITALPAALASAAGDLESIGRAVAAGSMAAAGPTPEHFGAHGALYQELSAEATAIHELFVATLGVSAASYAAAEAANAAQCL